MKRKIKEKEIEELKENIDLSYVENLLQNNEIEFEYKNQKYKVRKPTYKEKQEAYQKRIAKYNELLEATDNEGKPLYKTEEELKNIYKKRGIDLDELDNKFRALEQQKKLYQEKLGKALKEKRPDNELQNYKKEIENIIEEQKTISAKKSLLLESCIENQVLMFFYNYLAYLVTEKLENKKWVKAFKTYEEFLNNDEELINQLIFYISLIIIPE